MSFKKRTRRNFRKKATDLEDDGEETKEGSTPAVEGGENGGGMARGTAEQAKPSPVAGDAAEKRRDSRALLSFGDELTGEGPEFKVKKSSQSRRAAKMAEREKKARKKRVESDQVASYVTMEEGDSESGSDEEDGAPQVSLSQRLSEGFIPNAQFIHAVRKQREEKRQMGTANTAGFMPLSKKKVPMAKGKSRLIREDDNDHSDSGEEEGGRRKMDVGNHDNLAAKQFQVLQGLEERGSDSDEETKRWEEEQIEKGVKASAPDPQSAAPLPQQHSYLSAIEQSFVVGGAGGYGGDPSLAVPPSMQSYGGYQEKVGDTPNLSRIPENLVPITVESLKSRLSNHLRELQDTHSGHRQRLEQVRTYLETSQDEVEQASGKTGLLGLDYQFYQEMRGYLRDLLSCLAEKVNMVSGLEKAVLKMMKERADLLVERRRQDVQDQDKECSMQQEVQQIPTPPEILSRQRRAVEREGRRRRRREARVRGKQAGGEKDHFQGMSSDDELLEMNRLKFENSLSKALSRSSEVFSDVVEDFHKLSLIKQRLEEWKFSFPSSYSQAHVGLCLPQLFSPIVRLQMLGWNPLEADCPDFEAMSWFEVLMFYGYKEGVEPDPDDPDLRLIPLLVDRVVVPKITVLVQQIWDPLSSSQTHRLTALIRRLAEDYPTVSGEQKNTQSLFSAVLGKLRRATESDVYIPLYTSDQVENSLSQKAVFYNQQTWSCVKLLGNITEWAGLVSPDSLQELVLDGLLNRYLVLALNTCPPSSLSVTKTQAIISRLPPSWLSDGSTVTRPLQGLLCYLTNLAEQLHRSSLGHPDHIRQKTRAMIQQVTAQLVKLGAVGEATSVATQYNLPLPS